MLAAVLAAGALTSAGFATEQAGARTIAAVAPGTTTTETTILPLGSSGWRYQTGLTADGFDPNFDEPDYDDSGWAEGTGGFGNGAGNCPTSPDTLGTQWGEPDGSGDDQILLRHHFTLPAGATLVSIVGTTDDNEFLAVNGHTVPSFGGNQDGDCAAEVGNIRSGVPDSYLNSPGDNVIAVLGYDRGGPRFLDIGIIMTTFTEDPPLTRASVTAISPNKGPVGTTVVITGSHFTGTTRVAFGPYQADFSVVSDTEIDAIAPAGTGKRHIRVHTVGLSTKSGADVFRYKG